MLANILADPFIPIHWGKNQPGMQADTELEGSERADAILIWRRTLEQAVEQALKLEAMKVHKQVINRLLEPWMHITVIATATELDNFYALRYHKDAEPHFQALAKAMWEAQAASTPMQLEYGQWHLPLVPADEAKELGIENARKASVARCARVSYLNHDGTKPDLTKDIELHDRLLASGHCSPFEHQATPSRVYDHTNKEEKQSGNFFGWIQYRKTIPNENRKSFTPPA